MKEVFPPEKRAIAVFPLNNWGGIEITELTDERVEIAINNGSKRKHGGNHKLYTSSRGRFYFIVHGCRYYLDEFQRV